MGFFYFDFRNANKQSLRDLLPSLLTQLSARSSPRCDILSELYSLHDNGKNQPSDIVLTKCLQDMLSLPDQSPIYLIMDALDESPVTSEIPPARERVLQLLKDLVDLGLPNLHICITSRPEIDIRNAIEPLTSLRVSLHDETGQKEDIADYVRSIVYSNSDTNMRRWKKDDKEIVVKTLSERADGMYVNRFMFMIHTGIVYRFRWTFCQLVVLRDCLPSSVRHFLDELPESLDETYERVLREIKKPNRDHARRLLQCLVVAIRPLRVEELAEVLAIDFNDAEGVPKLNASWRWEDQERALLTSCSSLIAIVYTGGSRVVQFSHFSVKEYLTSERLATSSHDVSRYHITFETAHTILAQACVSVLLQLDDHDEQDDVEKKAPLAVYAAECWVRHAQFEDVVSRIKGTEDLFDVDKPYFAAWRELHDIDIEPRPGSVFFHFTFGGRRTNIPLYYAAHCGFANLVEQLIAKHPHHVNTIGGRYRTPALAALAGRHFKLAQVLHRNKSSVEPKGSFENTPLHFAAIYEDFEMVQVLLEFGLDVNARNEYRFTPLHYASINGHRNDARVARLLIAHGADPNSRDKKGFTPLHQASKYGRIEIVHLLIEHGANVEAKNDWGETPLYWARGEQREEIIKLLSEHVAK
jgi:ankyrin repeat protein